jgi:hypothetical protein
MAKRKTVDTGLTDLQKREEELKADGLEYEVFEYPHGYLDLLYRDADGNRVKQEYRPDGREILRDNYGVEVQ